MAAARALVVAFVSATFFWGGCVQPDALDVAPETIEATPVPETLGSGTECTQASAIMAYAGTIELGPFKQEDIRPDFPDAKYGSMGQPLLGEVSGKYVSLTRCLGADGFIIAWSAARVLPPPWDTSGVERHYLIDHLFYGTPEEAHHLMERIEWMVDPLAAGEVTSAQDVFHIAFQSGTSMGDYDAVVTARAVERVPPTTTRLWTWHVGDDGRDVVHSIDVVDVHEDDLWLGAGYEGAVAHWNTDMHGGATVAGRTIGGFGQPSWGEVYEGFSRVVSLGPSFTV